MRSYLRDRRLPWFGRDKRGRPRSAQSFRLVRDTVGGVVILAVTLGALFVASNGAWPPVLVIESGSMMHDQDVTPYGRLGTIDVGDMIFVRKTNDPLHNVHLWVDGGESHFGRPGDVVIYLQNGNAENTSIIHRAITYVEVTRAKDLTTTYLVRWTDHKVLAFPQRTGIYLPELGFDERFGFSPTAGWKPAYSGFVTKGDNAYTNPVSDQAAGLSDIVDPSWVVGTAHGEIPWMGLGKLATQSGKTNFEVQGWPRVGNAFAPVELWSMFFLCLGLLVLVPLTIDTFRLWRRQRVRRREERRVLAETARQRQERRVTEFQPITR